MTDDPASFTTEQPEPESGTGVQTDLFSIAGQGTASAETPDPASGGTGAPAGSNRKPIVFSDQEPHPRQAERKIPSGPKKNLHGIMPRRHPVHLDRKAFDADCTFGDLLKQAREQAGLTIEQVAALTKLRVHYLIALENADLDQLPPPVYVAAYIRTLCSLYALDPESEEFVHEKHRSIPSGKDVPRSLISDLESNGLSNEEENRRIRRIIQIGTAALVILAICIIWGIAAYFHGNQTASEGVPLPAENGLTAGAPEFTDAEFDRLTAPQQMSSSSLKMSRKPALAE